jgi:hypothetical protein
MNPTYVGRGAEARGWWRVEKGMKFRSLTFCMAWVHGSGKEANPPRSPEWHSPCPEAIRHPLTGHRVEDVAGEPDLDSLGSGPSAYISAYPERTPGPLKSLTLGPLKRWQRGALGPILSTSPEGAWSQP